MQAFIKCAGNKRRLAPTLVKWAPDDIDFYVEPFLGSGAVFFAMAEAGKIPDYRAVLNDSNTEIISAMKCARSTPHNFIADTNLHLAQHNKEYYYKIRGLNTEKLDMYGLAARFLYLNRTCFNGLYRVNSKGQFNVPIGDYKNPKISKVDIIAASHLLKQHCRILDNKDFVLFTTRLQSWLTNKAFVYFDPPYAKLNTGTFTKYQSKDFNEGDQRRLQSLIKFLTHAGVRVMLSNSDVPWIRELYSGYHIREVQMPRTINRNAKERGCISELVITNYEIDDADNSQQCSAVASTKA